MMKTTNPNTMDCYIGDRVLCVQVHGDAAFTGQGVVMESLGAWSGSPHPLLEHPMRPCLP